MAASDVIPTAKPTSASCRAFEPMLGLCRGGLVSVQRPSNRHPRKILRKASRFEVAGKAATIVKWSDEPELREMEAQDVAVAVLSAGNLYAGAGSRSAGDRKCDVRQPCRRRLARSRAGRLGAVEPAVGRDCR